MAYISNIDTLELTFDIFDYDQCMRYWLPILETAKSKASNYAHDYISEKVFVKIGNVDYEVLPNGAKGYAYILHNDQYQIKLSRFRSKTPHFHPIKVTCKAMVLWEKGYYVYQDISNFINDNIGLIKENQLSRVDMALHIDNLYLTIVDWDSFIGRFKKDQAIRYERKLETFYFGSRKTQSGLCRIYDKTKKVVTHMESWWFHSLWIENGLNPDHVWNVEFEMKRKFLKERNIHTYQDLYDNINGLWQYLTHEWLTYRIPNHDDDNHSRWKLQPIWLEIQKGYDNYEYKGKVNRSVQLLKDTSKYTAHLTGYMTSICALIDHSELDDAIHYVKSLITAYLKSKDTDFKEAILEKQQYFEKTGLDIASLMAKLSYEKEFKKL